MIARFDDGHVGAECRDEEPPRWAGLIVVRSPAGVWQVAASRREDVPRGAQLVECDGVPVERLYEQRVRETLGRWEVEAQRTRQAPRLLLDEHDPLLPLPRVCKITTAADVRDVTLAWEPITWNEWRVARSAAIGTVPPIGLRRVADGGWWITLSSSGGGDPAKYQPALEKLMTDLEANTDELRNAPFVVIDVRGNSGGSSRWGEKLAVVLWGQDFVKSVRPALGRTLWRASPGMLALHREAQRTLLRLGTPSSYFDGVVAGIESAVNDGALFYEAAAATPSRFDVPPPNPVRGKVVLLTDNACGSACLDLVDLIYRVPGLLHVGRPTSADTLYLELRTQTLAGDRVKLSLPSKIWPDRPRRSNVAYEPSELWTGDAGDEAGIEAWIRKLALPAE